MLPLLERFSSIQDFLDVRLGALRGTAVDTVSYCGVFSWPVWDYPRERIQALGKDPLKPAIEFVHGLGKDFFFNIRMNDCHVSGPHWQGPLYWEPFRLSRREFLQASIDENEWKQDFLPWALGQSRHYPLKKVQDRLGMESRETYAWAVYDYARVEVRDYFLGLIQEALERYDLDGIDLDWLRSPYFFKTGKARSHVPLMNDFVHRAATLVRDVSKKKKRPIALCMRVPDSPAKALELGLDVAHWIREGWIDHLVAGHGLSNFSMPFEPWRNLCEPYGVSLHACLSRSAYHHGDPSLFLGACQRLWKEGVDGIYFFNHFIQSEYGAMNIAADPRRLSRESKTYALDRQTGVFENGSAHDGPLPVSFIGLNGPTHLDFDITIPQTLSSHSRPTLKVRWQDRVAASGGQWRVNAKLAKQKKSVGQDNLEYEIQSLRSGFNRLRLELSAEDLKEKNLKLEAVMISLSNKR